MVYRENVSNLARNLNILNFNYIQIQWKTFYHYTYYTYSIYLFVCILLANGKFGIGTYCTIIYSTNNNALKELF